MADYDVVIAGASHNGLTCGIVLAKHGYKVLLLERMQRLKSYLNCERVDLSGSVPETVTFGCSVTVVDTATEESHSYNIIGPAEWDLELLSDMVTLGAPVARLLVTRKLGDIVDFKFGNNDWTGKITDIRVLE